MSIRTFASVRLAFVAVLISFVVMSPARAQEQEKKMLDRLLKPETSLENSAQNKKFAASGGVLTRIAHTKPFFVSRASWEKRCGGVKEYNAQQFPTNQSRFASQTADISPQTKLAKVDAPYSTNIYGTHEMADGRKVVPTSDYAAARPFLVQGKSQKSLNVPDRPMTIDEVRELLNKNK